MFSEAIVMTGKYFPMNPWQKVFAQSLYGFCICPVVTASVQSPFL